MNRKVNIRIAACLLLASVILSGCCKKADEPEITRGRSSAETEKELQLTGESAAGDSSGETAEETEEETFTYDIAPCSDPEKYPYFAELDDAEKQAYMEYMRYVEEGKECYVPEADYTSEQLFSAINAVYLEQPQLFWMANTTVHCYTKPETGTVAEVWPGYNELADDLKNNIAAFDQAAREALSGLYGLSDAEKERAIHDYLADHITYQSNSLDQNAYGALVNGACVCNGYARAFQYLLRCAGITAFVCQGQADGGTGWDNHAWNIVKLGADYYNVDVTWDDRDGETAVYSYYNVTDAFLEADHVRSDACAFLPACTGTACSFNAVFGMSADEYASRNEAAERGLTDTAVIESAEQFDRTIEAAMIAAGTGTHSYNYLVYGGECIQEIEQTGTDQNAVESHFMTAVINALGLNGYSWNLSFSWQPLYGSYYYLSMTISLTSP